MKISRGWCGVASEAHFWPTRPKLDTAIKRSTPLVKANGAVPCACKPGARVSSTEPRPHHDCDKLDKPCRRHHRETPVYIIKIKRFSAETMIAQSSGAASIDQHLSSPETRRCFAPNMARTIAMLRPLCVTTLDR